MKIYNLKINGSKTFKIIGSIICIIVVCLFVFAVWRVFGMAKDEGACINPNELSSIQSSNYTNILKSTHDNLDNYIGKKVNFSGYVYRIYDFKDSEFVLARDMVISSDNQTVVVGFLCDSKNAKDFEDRTWVEITGEITKGDYHGEIPIIKISDIKKCDKPNDAFVYPPDDTYLQTPEI